MQGGLMRETGPAHCAAGLATGADDPGLGAPYGERPLTCQNW